ncbi:MAG: RNA 2',3'-cyclic phosphodiesterase [Ottowia sp.]|nr:RNA 2',3'-cyclic phosphodiesterase [Ottowia sp.]
MRLFTAIALPDGVRRQLAAQLERAPALPAGVRLAPPQQWHITLRFIGEADAAQCAAIQRALHDVRAAPFTLQLGRFGSFGGTVLWCGVQGELDALRALHTAISAALQSAGIAPEKRRFAAHVTLARARRPQSHEQVRAQLADWCAAQQLWRSVPFSVRDFALYRSELHPAGARHSVLRRYTLAPSGTIALHDAPKPA